MPRDPLQYFRVEAKELVEQLSTWALDLERGSPGVTADVGRMLRIAHTLKGAARVVKQSEIAELSHELEDALAPLRDGKTSGPREVVDQVLGIVDRLVERVVALTSPRVDGESPASGSAEAPLPALRADVGEIDRLLLGLAEGGVQLGALRGNVAAVDALGRLAEVLFRQLSTPRRGRALEAADPQTLSLAEQLRRELPAVAHRLSATTDQVDTELGQVRDRAERLRLVPAALMFHVLERTTRDAAQSLGKSVAFHARGGDVQFDAHALGLVQNALVQVVRNAVAHGIESAAQRGAAGKAREGQVVLEVVRRGESVVFCCTDDGSGIDLDAVRREAERAGMPPAEARALDTERAVQLLLRGGISTSSSVTEVAGRGIGLDVVRDAASQLGGEVWLDTQALRGTSVTLSVPTALSSLEVLWVEAAGCTVGIPLGHVRRVLRAPRSEALGRVQSSSLLFEGQMLPLVPLARLLRRPGTMNGNGSISAVTVQSDAGGVALVVDRVVHVRHVLCRPLPKLTPADPIIAGVSVNDAGIPQLLLDPVALVTSAQNLPPLDEPTRAPRLPVLVVDDSLTTRMLEQGVLESAGFEVDLACSAEEALERARSRRYGLLLVDIEMPGMDGFELLERARLEPSLAGVPAILVSSRSSPEDRQRAERLGAHGYVIKSEFDQNELLRKIRQLVE